MNSTISTSSRPRPGSPNGPTVIDRCEMCSQSLPLRTALSHEQPIEWVCASCGTVVRAVLDEAAAADLRFNVFPSKMGFQCENLIHSAEEVANFIAKMTKAEATERRQRQWPRTSLISAATAMPLDECFQPIGVAFMVMLHNISGGGVAFSHTQPISQPFVALELWAPGNERLRVAMEIKRVRAVGHLWEIAGQFVTTTDD